MQIIPVNNYNFGCRFFNKKQTTPPVKADIVEQKEQILSQDSFQDLINSTMTDLKAKHGDKKVDTEYEIYTRFTNLEQRPTVSGVNDFADFVDSDFTGKLTDLMNEKVQEWRNDKDILRRYRATKLFFLKDDARSILKYELDRDPLDPGLDKNYKIKQDLFRNDRDLFLQLIKDNVVGDYSTSHSNKFSDIVQFYKDNPDTKVTKDMIDAIAWG